MKRILLFTILCTFLFCKGQTKQNIGSFNFLTQEELKTKSKEELKLIRNEVCARKGHIFKNEDLIEYFNKKAWYKPDSSVKIILSDSENDYIKQIKYLENKIKIASSLKTIDLTKEKINYEIKDFYIEEELKGFYNNDNIEDVIWIVDISTDNTLGGHAKEEYRLLVFLGTPIANEFKLLFESDKVIPCNNCETWENEAEYSFFDTKLENKTFSFSTNQIQNDNHESGHIQRNTFLFSFINNDMTLNKIIKKESKLDSDKSNTNVVSNIEKIKLKDFNVYDWINVDPAYLSD